MKMNLTAILNRFAASIVDDKSMTPCRVRLSLWGRSRLRLFRYHEI